MLYMQERCVVNNLYIDESGSITDKNLKVNPYFVISIIKVNDSKILKRNLKRFISKNFDVLKKLDEENKMFDVNGEFREIKGSELSNPLKKEFIDKICREHCLDIFYIKVDNHKLDKKFVSNKARVFNYLLKIFFIHSSKKMYIDKGIYNLQIDERNVKTQAKYQLAEYLNTELLLTDILDEPVSVKYFDSCNCNFIQVADVFSNIFYSNCLNSAYNEELNKLKNDGYIKEIFKFPLKSKEL